MYNYRALWRVLVQLCPLRLRGGACVGTISQNETSCLVLVHIVAPRNTLHITGTTYSMMKKLIDASPFAGNAKWIHYSGTTQTQATHQRGSSTSWTSRKATSSAPSTWMRATRRRTHCMLRVPER